MSNKNNDKKKFFWTIGGVVCVFIACLILFIQREKETAKAKEKPAEDISDRVWVDVEDALRRAPSIPAM